MADAMAKEKEEQARKAHAHAERCFLAGNVSAARQWMKSAVSLAPDLPGTPQIVAAYDVHAAAGRSRSGSARNWYAVLGLKKTGGAPHTHDDIKKQYRRLCLLVHPDKNPSAAADGAFKLVHAAWDALSAKHPPSLGTAGPAPPANKHTPPPPPQRQAAPPRPPEPQPRPPKPKRQPKPPEPKPKPPPEPKQRPPKQKPPEQKQKPPEQKQKPPEPKPRPPKQKPEEPEQKPPEPKQKPPKPKWQPKPPKPKRQPKRQTQQKPPEQKERPPETKQKPEPKPQPRQENHRPEPPTSNSQQENQKQDGKCSNCGAQRFNGRSNYRCMSCEWSYDSRRHQPYDDDDDRHTEDDYDEEFRRFLGLLEDQEQEESCWTELG